MILLKISIAVGFNRRLKKFPKMGFSPTTFVYVGLKPFFIELQTRRLKPTAIDKKNSTYVKASQPTAIDKKNSTYVKASQPTAIDKKNLICNNSKKPLHPYLCRAKALF